MLEDVSIDALQSAMHGLSARQRAISGDIANVNTPFYRAHDVAFEADLQRALDDGSDPLAVAPTTTLSAAPAGLNGNNVDLDRRDDGERQDRAGVPAGAARRGRSVLPLPHGDRGVLIVFDALGISGSGMHVHQTWMDAISDNIANVNTVRPAGQPAFQARYVVAQAVENGTGARRPGRRHPARQRRRPARLLPGDPNADAKGYVRRTRHRPRRADDHDDHGRAGLPGEPADLDRVRATYQAALQMGRG